MAVLWGVPFKKRELLSILIEKNFQGLCDLCAEISGNKEKYKTLSISQNTYEPWFSQIYNITIPKGEELIEISKIKNTISSGVYPNSLLIKDSRLTTLLESVLHNSGFKITTLQAMMSIDLSDYNYTDFDFTDVKVLDDLNDIKKWFKTAAGVFNISKIRLFEELFKQDKISFLALYNNGVIVATTMVFVLKEIAGLHFVGTNPDYRGKGFGSKITQYALKYAKDSGCSTAVLQASKLGKPMYEKIGFYSNEDIQHWVLHSKEG